MLCKKKRGESLTKEKSACGPQSIIEEVVGNEDLAFLISQYLYPKNRNPSRLHELCHNLCFVSRRWNEAFSLVRAQLRYDYLNHRIRDDEENGWLYHKLCYIPKTSNDVHVGEAGMCRIPREGCLRIFRSHCTKTMDDAAKEYKRNLRNDHGSGDNREDSRPDYYYQAHRETAECIELVLPRPLLCYQDSTIQFVNEIEYDAKPRLVNKFSACIGDINGCKNNFIQEKSVEGQWNLGYHEIVSVRDMTTRSCHPRPPLNEHGEATTSFLYACGARPSDDPRWIKLCHLVGENKCRLFLKKHLLPMIGPRPSGCAWNSRLEQSA